MSNSNANEVYLRAANVGMEFRALGGVKLPSADAKTSGTGARLVRGSHGLVMQALSGISFALKPGDSLALIGHNGAGKTTLLRTLAGVYHPPIGKVESSGLIGNALNINLGFRPEASGRRNIEIKALIGGYGRKDIPELMENVANFADLGPFLDAPIRTYSAGMRARLAFGIATAFKCDILLLDEWLGAGDHSMKRKAQERMESMIERSSIMVMASHAEGLLRQNCNLGLVLHHGEQKFFGPIGDALDYYTALSGGGPSED